MTEVTGPMILVSLLVAAAILWIKENTDLMTDTIMALLLSGSVALGVIILSMLRGSRTQIHSYLFGDMKGSVNMVMMSVGRHVNSVRVPEGIRIHDFFRRPFAADHSIERIDPRRVPIHHREIMRHEHHREVMALLDGTD